MALSQSALSELLDAIRAGGGEDTLRDAMTLVLQELIELDDPAITVVTSPSPLAGERAILSCVRRAQGFEVAVVSLADGSVRTIVENGFTPQYAATGHVLFQQGAGFSAGGVFNQ